MKWICSVLRGHLELKTLMKISFHELVKDMSAELQTTYSFEESASASKYSVENIGMRDLFATTSNHDLSSDIGDLGASNKTSQQAAPPKGAHIQNAMPVQSQAHPPTQSASSTSVAPEIVNLPGGTHQHEPNACGSAPSFEAGVTQHAQPTEGIVPILCVSTSDPVPILQLILNENRDFHKSLLEMVSEVLKKGDKQPQDNMSSIYVVGPQILPFEQLKNEKEFNALNETLKKENGFAITVENALKSFYVPELYTKTISDILSSTFETEFSKNVRNKGKDGKIAFEGTSLCEIIVGAVNSKECHPKIGRDTIVNYIGQWLRQTNDRGKKRQSKGEILSNNKKRRSDSNDDITE